ncbi:NADH dehydrogenase domain-containing protein [Desulfonema limicola]|uniref:NADH dehydrogenase domain-containing protein n=1 Tax=Desulfonema limicola TaxID=45656 RepID=A0A975GJD8_9BACT|nr:SDR family oxidoreductase [Desulfonema limicola]QTA83606.1 NADH dehydrogenase domain-containing protein [Desulfonema limicola]
MKINFKKALITGGAGFIGSHLAETLVNAGCEVSILDNLSTGSLSNIDHIKDKITFFQGDIQEPGLLTRYVKGCDIIFHQAALVSVPQSVEEPVISSMINNIGTLMVLEAARQNGVKRVVLASSSAVYGDNPESPKQEDMKPRLLSPYAVQKLTGELNASLYYELYGLETVCLRYFNVYGPRQDPSSPYSGVISIFMTKAFDKKQPLIYGNGEQTRDFVFVKDVVKANLLAATVSSAAGRIFNIGTGSCVTINRLWEVIARMAGLDLKPGYGPPRPGDIIESLSDISRAKSELGFEPGYSFEQGLELTMEWYKNSKKS